MKISFITSGGSGGGSDTNTWRPVTAGGNTLTGAPSGETLAFTAGTGITITESAGAVTITNSGGTNTNIANTDLTLDGARRLSLDNNNLAINNASAEALLTFGGSGTTFQIGHSTSAYLMPLTRPADGDVLTASNGTGTIGWATPDANTNLATNNLTASGTTRTMKVASSGTLAFQSNGGTQALKIDDSAQVSIGGASPYIMPTARASAQYKALVSTDGSGATSWETLTAGGGAMFMFMSGSTSSWASASYGWYKKNGGAMYIDTDLTVGAANAQGIEMFIWDGRVIPSAYRYVGKRDAGAAAGLDLSIFFDTPASTNIVWTQEADIATGLLADSTTSWQTYSGEIDAGAFSNASAGDFFSFGLQAEDALTNVTGWLTIYFSSVIEY